MRDYCPDRPGLGTPGCTIDPGHISVELGMADWTLDRTSTERTDTLLLGDVLIRYGIADHAEVQVSWTSFGREHDRDRSTGGQSTDSGVGDVLVAIRRNLARPDGSGFSLALMGIATVPVGREPIGAGDWGAALRMPISYALDDRFTIELVPEVDAAVDSDGVGRHFAYSTVAGLQTKLDPEWSATAEYQFIRDRDPAGHESQQLAGLSLGWQPRDDLQFDVGANNGLNRHTPDLELYIGVSRRF
ncbi:MAG: transporter [Pseudomonadota bacterium]